MLLSRRCRRLAAPGRYTRPQPKLIVMNFNIYTIHIVKERFHEAQKNPGGYEPTGALLGAFLGGSIFEPPKNHS